MPKVGWVGLYVLRAIWSPTFTSSTGRLYTLTCNRRNWEQFTFLDNFQTLARIQLKKTRIISISNVLFDPANHTLKTVKNPPLLLYLEVPLMDHYNVSWCQFLSLWSRCKFIDRLILKLTDVLFFPPPPSPPPPHTFPILSLFSSTERRDAQLPTNKSQTGG